MAVSAADVKRLRDETDAPMMECRGALEEAGGDFEKAKVILREKGKAAAVKRADRSTGAGVVAIASSPDNKTVGAVVLECETDFVAKNEDFIKVAQEIAEALVQNEPGSDPNAVPVNGKTVGAVIEEAVAKIRENIKVTSAVQIKSDAPVASYVHHDNTKGAIVKMSGDSDKLLEVGKKVAIQAVAMKPKYVRKEDISKDIIDRELEIETQRALNEGKNEQIAKNIAQGRINKEFYKEQVLLEQPFYADNSKSVGQYLQEESKASGGSIAVDNFKRLIVGGGE